MALIGVISDTHGLLREEVKELFKDCEMILHAGDAGKIPVLDELRKLKQTVAVRGNVDYGPWAEELKIAETVVIENKKIFIIHNIGDLSFNPKDYNIDAVIYGHSHKAVVNRKDGVLYFNPGSAGPVRFRLPVTAGLLKIENGTIEAEIISLNN